MSYLYLILSWQTGFYVILVIELGYLYFGDSIGELACSVYYSIHYVNEHCLYMYMYTPVLIPDSVTITVLQLLTVLQYGIVSV